MSLPLLQECVPLLERTPNTLNTLLRGLPEPWIRTTDGPGTWSAFDVMGHLLHGERQDWLVRARIILKRDPEAVFPVFDREAMLRENAGRTLDSLLDDFAAARRQNLHELLSWNLHPADLELTAKHPVLGPVTLHHLLATWAAHDMAHLLQISRTMARRLRPEIGPFAEFLSVMQGAA